MQSFNIYDESNDNDDDLHTRVLLLEDDVLCQNFLCIIDPMSRFICNVTFGCTRSNITAVMGIYIYIYIIYRPVWNDIK